MTDKELDDIFKNAFANHEMPVPDDMWQRIQPQQEPKRRLYAWWITAGSVAAITVIVVAALWWHPAAHAPKQPAETHIAKKEQAATTTGERNLLPSEQSSSTLQSTGAPNNTAQNGQPEARMPKPSAANPLDDKMANNKAAEPRQHKAGAMADGHYVNSSIASAEKLRKSQKTFIYPNKKDNAQRAKQPEDELAATTAANAIHSKESKTLQAKEKTLSDSDLNNSGNTAETEIAAGNTADNTIKSSQTNSLSADSSSSVAAAANPHHANTPVTIRKTHGKNSLGISLLAGAFTGTRNVYAEKASQMSTLTRLATYDPKVKTVLRGLGTQLQIDKALNNHFSVVSGIQYQSLQQSVSYLHETVNQYAVLNTVGFNTDTARYTQISFQRPVLRSTYNSINIPLLLSYHTEQSKLKWGITAGAVVNAYSWYSGEVPSAGYKDVLQAREVYKPFGGAALYAAARVGKDFGSWQLFAEPHVQLGLNSITKGSAGFKQRLNNYGVSAGVRREINLSKKHYR